MALMIICPLCGKCDGYEFRYGGEDHGPRPAEDDLTPESWYHYVHGCDNPAPVVTEWWCHRDGCGAWFTIRRNPKTNRQVQETP
jgi:sarcosine oxidase, subunit delta